MKKMSLEKFAKNPPAVLPKTESQRIKELKDMMVNARGKDVVSKVLEIALNDEHPGQITALKMCMDRTLPVSMFEKDKGARSAVTINITGIGDAPIVNSVSEEVIDV